MTTHRIVIDLEEQAVFRLPDVSGTRIECLAGAAWITYDGDRTETVLQPGQTCVLTRKGAVIQALREGKVALHAPQEGRRAAPAWLNLLYRASA